MCDAEVKEIDIPVIDKPGTAKKAYKVTVRDFKVSARRLYNYYIDKDLAYYIANKINEKALLEDD